MLKTITTSTNKKLGGCASTYRAGSGNKYSTCPNSCPLKPANTQGTTEVDQEYLEALLDAVPKGGCGWTYTHFGPGSVPTPSPGRTVINLSSDSYEQAVAYSNLGYPTTVTVPHTMDAKVEVVDEVRFVRCPAEYNSKVNCDNCGSGRPLCARADRDYVIKFTAHGTQAKLVGKEAPGGCYGSGGPVAIHWGRTANADSNGRTDAQILKEWVDTLPYGTKVRHHVLGDLGYPVTNTLIQ